MPGWSRNRSAPVAPAEEQIAGYRDLHRIGHGGFSVVYRAHQVGLDRVVALKVLQVEFVDAQIKRRFLREVRLTGRLSGHPNVVTVLDSGLTGSGRPYIAMDLYERGSLRDRLLASGPLPLPEVLRVGVKIAGALDAAHREGIVHRDVKPQNILVSRYGEPALADFGTARLVAEIDASARTEALTPFHAAPEVLEGQPPTQASDVYSLGSTLYQLLAGRAAFQRDGDFGIAPLLLRIVSEEPPPLRDVPEAVEAAIRLAMHRDPSSRYGTMAELLSVLQGLQHGLGLSVTEVPGGMPPGLTDAAAASEGAVSGDDEDAVSGDDEGAGDGDAGFRPGPLPGFPLIKATEWEFAEKTGYRTGHPATAQDPSGWAQPGNDAAPGHPAAADLAAAGTAAYGGVPHGMAAHRTAAEGAAGDGMAARGVPPYAPGEITDPQAVAVEAAGHAVAGDRRPRTMTFAAAGVLVIIAIAVPLVLAGARHATPQPSPSGHPTATAQPTGMSATGFPTATAPASEPPSDAAARDATPTGLTVTVAGLTATLRWKLAPGNDYPLIIDQPSTGQPPAPLTAGTTSYTVIGLHPGTDYCFKVGAVTADSSQAVTIQWSNVACVPG